MVGAIMLNGIACGMIYLPLEPTTRKPFSGTPVSDRQRHSDDNLMEQCIRSTSTCSLQSPDGAVISKEDICLVRVTVADSISRSLHAVNNDLTEVRLHFAFGVLYDMTFTNMACSKLTFKPVLFHAWKVAKGSTFPSRFAFTLCLEN